MSLSIPILTTISKHRCGLVVLSLSVSLVAGCHHKVAKAKKAAPPLLPVVTLQEVPPPGHPSVTVERGKNLQSIAKEAYGHRDFAGFIATVNEIPDPGLIASDTTLKTPSLAVAFRDAGAAPIYQPILNALAKACTDYYAIEPNYLAARQASGVLEGKFSIPSEIQSKLLASANTVDAGIAELSAIKAPDTVPKMAIGQFKQAADQLRELAKGSIERNGYDYDLVGQRFARGFTNALIWTQQKHR